MNQGWLDRGEVTRGALSGRRPAGHGSEPWRRAVDKINKTRSFHGGVDPRVDGRPIVRTTRRRARCPPASRAIVWCPTAAVRSGAPWSADAWRPRDPETGRARTSATMDQARIQPLPSPYDLRR